MPLYLLAADALATMHQPLGGNWCIAQQDHQAQCCLDYTPAAALCDICTHKMILRQCQRMHYLYFAYAHLNFLSADWTQWPSGEPHFEGVQVGCQLRWASAIPWLRAASVQRRPRPVLTLALWQVSMLRWLAH